MKTFKLIIEYDGTNFNGWQIQKTGRTIQGRIEKALSVMTRQHVRITGSGRTDAGVHALGQVAHFRCHTRLEAGDFLTGLNSLLPDDIVIHSCTRESDTFHARYDAKEKTYQYHILNRPRPSALGRLYALHVAKPLDIKAMEQAAGMLSGTHDFSAFENTGSPRSTSVRTVFQSRLYHDENLNHIVFEITANGFLRYMVRNIVGTLLETGRSKISQKQFVWIMASKDRNQAGPTAPAHGLFLISVKY